MFIKRALKPFLALVIIPAAAFAFLAYLGAASGMLWPVLILGAVTTLAVALIAGIALGQREKRLARRSISDELTGTANRREFERQLEKSLYRHGRYLHPVSLILLDVDRFAEINEQMGPAAADGVLIQLTNIVERNIRPDDLLARWGSDEFMLLLESTTEQAVRSAERLKALLAQSELQVSMGITSYQSGMSPQEFLANAEAALRQSKSAGQDRITVA